MCITLGHSRKHPYHPHGGNRKLTPLPPSDVLLHLLLSETIFSPLPLRTAEISSVGGAWIFSGTTHCGSRRHYEAIYILCCFYGNLTYFSVNAAFGSLYDCIKCSLKMQVLNFIVFPGGGCVGVEPARHCRTFIGIHILTLVTRHSHRTFGCLGYV